MWLHYVGGYNSHSGGWANGDSDYSGLTDSGDVIAFLAAWNTAGSQVGPPASAAAAAVPEPSCLILLTMGGLLLLGYKKFIKD